MSQGEVTVEGVVKITSDVVEAVSHVVDQVVQAMEHDPEKARELGALMPEIDEIVISIGIVVDHLSLLRSRLEGARAKLKSMVEPVSTPRASIVPESA